METKFSREEKAAIQHETRRKYANAARSLEGLFRYPTGRAGLEALRYDPAIISALPAPALASYCGVGNPFSLGPLQPGEKVLDIGCGGAVDTFIAAFLVGPAGQAVGIDATPEMLVRAGECLREVAISTVAFVYASGEDLPFVDGAFDVAISNGAFNLIPDKTRALGEVFRVLRAGGRLMLADQVLTGKLPDDTAARVALWAKWEGGAIPGKDFLALMEKVGFVDVELVGETGFNSSPTTKGALFRARKAITSEATM